MLQPESTLRQLVDQLKERVQVQEAEVANFEERAQRYLSALKEDILQTKRRIELFSAEMDAMMNGPRPSDPTIADSSRSKSESVVQESQSERIREVAKQILAKSDRPLMQSEIKARMDKAGVEIVAKNVTELVRAALRRHPSEFRHIKGQGWCLVDQRESVRQ